MEYMDLVKRISYLGKEVGSATCDAASTSTTDGDLCLVVTKDVQSDEGRDFTEPFRIAIIDIMYLSKDTIANSTHTPCQATYFEVFFHFKFRLRAQEQLVNTESTMRLGWNPASLLTASAVATLSCTSTAATSSPTEKLGSCLTHEWVAEMEQTLHVTASDRAAPPSQALLHPFLHSAIQVPRFSVEDTRTSSSKAYESSCMPEGDEIFAPVDPSETSAASVLSSGPISGSLVVEMVQGNDAQTLIAMVLAILAFETLGYSVSIYSTSNELDTQKRLSFTHSQGECTPTHISLAVPSGLVCESEDCTSFGSVGFTDSKTVFTTVSIVDAGVASSPAFFADYWRDYGSNDDLITAHAESNLRANSTFFPPSTSYCDGDAFGCQNHCSRSYACYQREQNGKECVVVVIESYRATLGYIESLLSNLDIPAYFCFVGRETLEAFIIAMHQDGNGALAFLSIRDAFLRRYPALLQRVLLPRAGMGDNSFESAKYFGENGYGEPSNRTFGILHEKTDDVLQKMVAINIEGDANNDPVAHLTSRFRIIDYHLTDLLDKYVVLTNSSSTEAEYPHFDAACSWVRDNYNTWEAWMSPLPECTIDHMDYNITGCDSQFREISFKWKVPNPANASLPYVCDGGYLEIPMTLRLSSSCDVLSDQPSIWISRLTTLPPCSPPDSMPVGRQCLTNGKRLIEFVWKIADPNNPALSLECDSTAPRSQLQQPMYVDCEYMPSNSTASIAIAVITCLVMLVIVVAMILIAKHRNIPIIRRSQFEFLEVMLVGALLICIAVLLFAGEPTNFLCGARPTVVAFGFTMVFGSLIVKSLRVYRVFLSRNLKRIVLPTTTMFKILGAFLLVDSVVLVVWFVADFPSASQVEYAVQGMGGGPGGANTVTATKCSSSSFIFSAILMFWKTVLLGSGLYLSFLIRHVSVDFQESIWIFASSVVVGFACVLLLPLAYLVELPAATFYWFLALVLLVCTLMVIGFMLVPKVLRQKEAPSTTTNGSTISASSYGSESSRGHESASPAQHQSRPNNHRIIPKKS